MDGAGYSSTATVIAVSGESDNFVAVLMERHLVTSIASARAENTEQNEERSRRYSGAGAKTDLRTAVISDSPSTEDWYRKRRRRIRYRITAVVLDVGGLLNISGPSERRWPAPHPIRCWSEPATR